MIFGFSWSLVLSQTVLSIRHLDPAHTRYFLIHIEKTNTKCIDNIKNTNVLWDDVLFFPCATPTLKKLMSKRTFAFILVILLFCLVPWSRKSFPLESQKLIWWFIKIANFYFQTSPRWRWLDKFLMFWKRAKVRSQWPVQLMLTHQPESSGESMTELMKANLSKLLHSTR